MAFARSPVSALVDADVTDRGCSFDELGAREVLSCETDAAEGEVARFFAERVVIAGGRLFVRCGDPLGCQHHDDVRHGIGYPLAKFDFCTHWRSVLTLRHEPEWRGMHHPSENFTVTGALDVDRYSKIDAMLPSVPAVLLREHGRLTRLARQRGAVDADVLGRLTVMDTRLERAGRLGMLGLLPRSDAAGLFADADILSEVATNLYGSDGVKVAPFADLLSPDERRMADEALRPIAVEDAEALTGLGF